MMNGVINFLERYKDRNEMLEIRLKETREFPFVNDQRVEYPIIIGDLKFIAGVRFTERNRGWISQNLTGVSGEKIRLSEILVNNGYKRNQRITIAHDLENKILILE